MDWTTGLAKKPQKCSLQPASDHNNLVQRFIERRLMKSMDGAVSIVLAVDSSKHAAYVVLAKSTCCIRHMMSVHVLRCKTQCILILVLELPYSGGYKLIADLIPDLSRLNFLGRLHADVNAKFIMQ